MIQSLAVLFQYSSGESMYNAAILLMIVVVVLLYMGSRFLRDARGIRRELADGRTLKELDEMVLDTRETLLNDYDKITGGIDQRLDRLEKHNREAEAMIVRLETLLNSERLKTLEDRGILFAIEAGESTSGEQDRAKRIAELLRSGASVEEVSRITEAGIREVELVKMLLRRREEAEGA